MRWAPVVLAACLLLPSDGSFAQSPLSRVDQQSLRGAERRAGLDDLGDIVPASERVVEGAPLRLQGAFAPLFEMLVVGGGNDKIGIDKSSEVMQNPFDSIADKVKDAVDATKDAGEKAISKAKEALSHAKPVMDRINILRTNMCWKRADRLMEHKPCLKFLGTVCQKESTGEGICKKFTKDVGEECEKSDDPEMKELLCKIADDLGYEMATPAAPAPAEAAPAPAPAPEDVKSDDTDGDGVPNAEDAFPDDPAESKDTDNDGVGDNSDPDIDGDGVDNAADKFPTNSSEHEDTDGDGIGDNSDTDIDGDGVPNEEDAFPKDPSEVADLDGDGIGDNSDPDVDGDGIPNGEDAFPRDSKEWGDADGDGIGDNADAFPHNSDCWDDTKGCDSEKVADEETEGFVPTETDKVEKELPSQGYDEHAPGPHVEHNNDETYTGDWHKEWPEVDESEKESIRRICKENPRNDWCRRYAEHGLFAR